MATSEWASRIRALTAPILIGLDVDGTLAPIVDDPGAARVPPDVARAIERLAKRGWHLALVTGRDDASLAPVAPIRGVWRVVEHGRQTVAPGKRARRTERAEEKARLDPFERWARAELVPSGARLEVKRGARVIHVRELAKKDAKAARVVAARAARAAAGAGLAARSGRAVVEVELEPSDKGTAFRALYTKLRARSAVYAGDDLTDRPAIAFAARHGLGFFVRSSERPRKFREATGALAGPAEVGALLVELARDRQDGD